MEDDDYAAEVLGRVKAMRMHVNPDTAIEMTLNVEAQSITLEYLDVEGEPGSRIYTSQWTTEVPCDRAILMMLWLDAATDTLVEFDPIALGC